MSEGSNSLALQAPLGHISRGGVLQEPTNRDPFEGLRDLPPSEKFILMGPGLRGHPTQQLARVEHLSTTGSGWWLQTRRPGRAAGLPGRPGPGRGAPGPVPGA